MSVTVDSKVVFASLSPEHRTRVEKRAAELINEEMTLRALRKAMALTQVKLAKALGTSQESVSRLEKRSDMLLSTLSSYVEAMGGSLRLVAEFPERGAVQVQLGDILPEISSRQAKQRAAKRRRQPSGPVRARSKRAA